MVLWFASAANEFRSSSASTVAAPAVLTSRIQALVDMLKMNMSIHTIRLSDCYCEHELFRGTVIPYLETNRLRPHDLAIQKTRSAMYRAKVLGRAFHAARTDANSLSMFFIRESRRYLPIAGCDDNAGFEPP
jgi:hypothetical protein